MATTLSTGSPQLDDLIEELQPQDNVVFFTEDRDDYVPFVRTLARHVAEIRRRLVYVRGDGSLDDIVARHPSPVTLDVHATAWEGLLESIEAIGGDAYYVFESLSVLEALAGDEAHLRDLFLTLCPRLFQLRSVAYWDLAQHRFAASTVAAIRDCTQVFIRVERNQGNGWVVTPLKVWGRYSDAMFKPHWAQLSSEGLLVSPLSADADRDGSYVAALADKNRELAEVRDILSRRNDELSQRNAQLAALNARVAEQSHLYESLSGNLEHLTSLLRAGWEIGGTLVREQVYQAVLLACTRLFPGCGARVYLPLTEGGPVDLYSSDPAGTIAQIATTDVVTKGRSLVLDSEASVSARLLLPDSGAGGSVALAPLIVRGRRIGTIEVYADDERLDDHERRLLLTYLASEASIALDNADLYQETDLQREQLRTFVTDVIRNDERESRQLALDLHDGLVQMIVGSYQHLQAAQAWRGRDAHVEEAELVKGVQILRDAIVEARRLIAQLRPAGLDDFGLEQALRVYLGEARNLSAWEVNLTVHGALEGLSPEVEASLFRIVQEATHNALRYAQAERLDVSLEAREQELVLSIVDSGRGFEPGTVRSQPEKGLHVGLVGIRERARMLGGSCEITSSPGAGTRLVVRIPWTINSMSGEEQA
ncbi:MAG: GAF domain-containing sensor histidine kinase [Chloroflexi bacterium]|nr:GAF domain-containing sensor histidine kinase [Chloroflexota bacterium]